MQPAREIQVLIVDDIPPRRGMLSAVLQRHPATNVIGEAQTVSEGLQLHRFYQPDVTLLDVSMLREQTAAVICELRAADPIARIVVIESPEERRCHDLSQRAGAVGQVTKPVDADHLVAVVQQAVEPSPQPASPAKVLIGLADPEHAAQVTATVEYCHQEVVGVAANPSELLGLFNTYAPQAVILSFDAPLGEPAQMIRCLTGLDAHCRILLLAKPGQARAAAEMVRIGVCGVVFHAHDREVFAAELLRMLDSEFEPAPVSPLSHATTIVDGTPPPAPIAAAAAPPAPAPDEPWKPGVLVVEDHAMMRRILQKVVAAAGCELLAEAENGAQCRELFSLCQPDLTLLDIELPDASGLDLLREIRDQDPNAIVMMITGQAEAEVVRTAVANGAAGYVLKPFTPTKVAAEIQNVMGLAPTE